MVIHILYFIHSICLHLINSTFLWFQRRFLREKLENQMLTTKIEIFLSNSKEYFLYSFNCLFKKKLSANFAIVPGEFPLFFSVLRKEIATGDCSLNLTLKRKKHVNFFCCSRFLKYINV